MNKIILATSSKFKSDLLKSAGIEHICIESDFIEKSEEKDIYNWSKDIAFGKAKEVAKKIEEKNIIVIGVDTIVYCEGKIYTKPSSLENVFGNMQELNGKKSSVITGICVINKENGKVLKDYAETFIYLNKMTEEEIRYYINNEEYVLQASGFVVENILSRHIKKIEGSYVNILGMPNETIYNMLKEIK